MNAAHIGFEQRYLQDLKQMKKEENAKAELTDGRRRWFNREMDKVRSKIDELLQKQNKENN